MENREISINLNLQPSDFIQKLYFEMFDGALKISTFVFIMMLPLAIIFCALRGLTSMFNAFISFLPMLLYLIYAFSFIPKKAQQEYEQSRFRGKIPLFKMDNEGIVFERANGQKSTISFENLRALLDRKSQYYFYIAKNNKIMLPKRQLTAADTAFIEEIRKSLPKSKQRNPDLLKPTQALGMILMVVIILMMIALTLFAISLPI